MRPENRNAAMFHTLSEIGDPARRVGGPAGRRGGQGTAHKSQHWSLNRTVFKGKRLNYVVAETPLLLLLLLLLDAFHPVAPRQARVHESAVRNLSSRLNVKMTGVRCRCWLLLLADAAVPVDLPPVSVRYVESPVKFRPHRRPGSDKLAPRDKKVVVVGVEGGGGVVSGDDVLRENAN